MAAKGDTSSIFSYNEEEQTQQAGNVVLHTFDPVTVRLMLESKNIQHEKFVLQLVKPYVKGFSVEEEVDGNKKRKNDANEQKHNKRKSKN